MSGDPVPDAELIRPESGPERQNTKTLPSGPPPADSSIEHIQATSLVLGAELHDDIEQLVTLTQELSNHAEPEVAGLIERACAAFDGQNCKIAVLGQSQSGKSSLINALTRCDTLLPTGSAPWTAALTRVHVGQRAPVGARAVFSFFDEAEWHRLSEQGGRVRELAERLLPGFDAIRLRSQLADVRQRVRKKLGPSYFELCGQAHSFDSITPSLVARYVGSGGENGSLAECEYAYRGRAVKNASHALKCVAPRQSNGVAADATTEGMYSELTRNADLYLDGPARSIPFSLIDTPGTNDPFLVREEITIAATEDADICLVVLDATRPIEEADVALLRILRSLGRERIVVFVNKIDQLNNVVSDVKHLHDSLRRVFSREVPSAQVSFVFGSAKWAKISRASANELNGTHEWRKLIPYAAYATDASPNKRAEWERTIPSDGKLRQSLLQACSGFPELEATLNWKICRSRLGTQVHQASSTFATVASNTAGALQTDAAVLRREYDTAQQAKIEREDERRRRATEVDRLKRLVTQLELQCQRSVDALNTSKKDFKARLEARLQEEIRTFAEHHSASLLQKLRAGESVRTIVCDPNPLRQRVAEIFVREFRHARHNIMNSQRLTAARLHYLLSQVLPDTRVQLDFGQLSSSWVYPSLAPLGQTLTFDLGKSWWTQWWKRRNDPEVMAANLRRLILEEFIPVSAQIVAIADKDITSEIDTAAWQLALSRNKVAHCIEDRKKMLVSDHAKRLGHQECEVKKLGLAQRLKIIEGQAADCRKLAEHFSSLATRWG